MELEKCALCENSPRKSAIGKMWTCDCCFQDNSLYPKWFTMEHWNDRQRLIRVEARVKELEAENQKMLEVISVCASGCPYPECRIDHEKWGSQVCSYSCPQSRLTAEQALEGGKVE